MRIYILSYNFRGFFKNSEYNIIHINLSYDIIINRVNNINKL